MCLLLTGRNLAPAFIEQFAARHCISTGAAMPRRSTETFGPEDLLAYIYALFHSPTYRERHADVLRSDFPHFLPPRSRDNSAHCLAWAASYRFASATCPRSSARYRPPFPPTLPMPAGTFRGIRTTHSAIFYPSRFFLPCRRPCRPQKWLQPKHRSTSDPTIRALPGAIARTWKSWPNRRGAVA